MVLALHQPRRPLLAKHTSSEPSQTHHGPSLKRGPELSLALLPPWRRSQRGGRREDQSRTCRLVQRCTTAPERPGAASQPLAALLLRDDCHTWRSHVHTAQVSVRTSMSVSVRSRKGLLVLDLCVAADVGDCMNSVGELLPTGIHQG